MNLRESYTWRVLVMPNRWIFQHYMIILFCFFIEEDKIEAELVLKVLLFLDRKWGWCSYKLCSHKKEKSVFALSRRPKGCLRTWQGSCVYADLGHYILRSFMITKIVLYGMMMAPNSIECLYEYVHFQTKVCNWS